MARLIYHEGPPSVGLHVPAQWPSKAREIAFKPGKDVQIFRGQPSPELPEEVVAATLRKKTSVAKFERYQEPKPKTAAPATKEKKGGDS